MKKSVASLILVLLLALSALVSSSQIVGVKTANADEGAVVWRFTEPLDWFETYGWEGETEESYDVTYYVMCRFPLATYEWTGLYSYPSKSTFLSVVEFFDEDFDYATVFLYGHGYNTSRLGYWYYYETPIYSEEVEYFRFLWDTGETVWDDEIFYRTYSKNHYFVVMWPCAAGKVNGYYDEDDLTYYPEWYYLGVGPTGFPYCWTHIDDLSTDGYAEPDESDYCFIGFETFGEPLVNQTGYNGNTYGDFVKNLYYNLLTNGDPINTALDAASYSACGQSKFNETVLYNGWIQYVPLQGYWPTKMRIYGNGENVLPT